MSYAKRPSRQYRRKPQGYRPRLESRSIKGSLSRVSRSSEAQEVSANIMDLSMFLAKYLSGSNNIVLTPKEDHQGFAVGKEEVGGKERYNIMLPDWTTYKIPVKKEVDRFRIYRKGLWHESMHIDFTPGAAYYYGARKNPGQAPRTQWEVTDPLGHDVMNIIEDRRIEDLGCDMWQGYKGERLFVNGYFWALRDDVGKLWEELVVPALDAVDKGAAKISDDWIRKRFGRVRHEAFLQRLLVGKIKGGTNLPPDEWLKIDEAAHYVEDELDKIKEFKDDNLRVFATLKKLTRTVILNLDLLQFQPDVKEIGDTSWSKTFTQDFAEEQGADEEDVEKGVRNYFDEIWKVEKICPICGQHFVKKYGVRKD